MTETGLSTAVIIPAKWESGRVRIFFTAPLIAAVVVNGAACKRVEDPARRFTAWYTTEEESAFAIPAGVIRWDEPNEITVTPRNRNDRIGTGTAGLQLDLSSDPQEN